MKKSAREQIHLTKKYLQAIRHYQGKSYYSETGEDAVISKWLGNCTGEYADVGAGHPIFGNNTFSLYRKGWKGIAVDGNEIYEPLWRLFRKRDIFLAACASSSNQELIDFYEFENPLLNTTSQTVAESLISSGQFAKKKSVRNVSPRALLPPSLTSSEQFVLSLDIEGGESEFLAGINFEAQRPKFILVESWTIPWEKPSDAHKFLISKSYRAIAYTGLTELFIAEESLSEIKSRAMRGRSL